MTKNIARVIFFILTLWTTKSFSQVTLDNSKVSTEKELNFAFTEKRGIKADNGIIYIVESNGQTMTAYENNTVKWTADIFKDCPKPKVGKPEIRYIKLTVDKIELTFGKHDFASVDLLDGKVKYLGAD
jgi:hypothetical protein